MAGLRCYNSRRGASHCRNVIWLSLSDMVFGAGQKRMRRREFITFLGGLVASWPPVARAQQPARGKWRIGILAPQSRQPPLRQGLRQLGYLEGNNLTIYTRTHERTDQLAALAAELVALNPDAIVAVGTQATQAIQQATKRIPIIMVASDPVGTHLV